MSHFLQRKRRAATALATVVSIAGGSVALQHSVASAAVSVRVAPGSVVAGKSVSVAGTCNFGLGQLQTVIVNVWPIGRDPIDGLRSEQSRVGSRRDFDLDVPVPPSAPRGTWSVLVTCVYEDSLEFGGHGQSFSIVSPP